MFAVSGTSLWVLKAFLEKDDGLHLYDEKNVVNLRQSSRAIDL